MEPPREPLPLVWHRHGRLTVTAAKLAGDAGDGAQALCMVRSSDGRSIMLACTEDGREAVARLLRGDGRPSDERPREVIWPAEDMQAEADALVLEDGVGHGEGGQAVCVVRFGDTMRVAVSKRR